jgi:hypothetical protein
VARTRQASPATNGPTPSDAQNRRSPATAKDANQAKRGEGRRMRRGCAGLGRRQGVVGASSTSLTMKAKPTASQLAIRTTSGPGQRASPAAAPSVVMTTNAANSWNDSGARCP